MVENDEGNSGGNVNDDTDYKKIAGEVVKHINIPEKVDEEKLKADILKEFEGKIPEKVDVEDIINKAVEKASEKIPEKVDREALKTEILTEIKKDIPQATNEEDIITKAITAMEEKLKPPEPKKVKIRHDSRTAARLILGDSLEDVQVREGEEDE